MFGKRKQLPKDELIELLERNPPELFSALSNAILEEKDSKFSETAKKTAYNISSLIDEVRSMNIYQLEDLLKSVQKYLK